MTNQAYTPYRASLLGSGTRVDWDADDIRAVLIDSADYTFSVAHDFLDDIPGAARVAVSATLTVNTAAIDSGTADVADFSWPLVSGDQSEYVVFYDHTGGADNARRLIFLFDTFSSGMPVTPNGGDINYLVNAAGIFTVG